jgi:hypothetical protein
MYDSHKGIPWILYLVWPVFVISKLDFLYQFENTTNNWLIFGAALIIQIIWIIGTVRLIKKLKTIFKK